MMKYYELVPAYSKQKSFYKKAIVAHQDDQHDFLISYTTVVALVSHGIVYRLSDHYSQTTMKHINEFVKQQKHDGSISYSKREWMELPLFPLNAFTTHTTRQAEDSPQQRLAYV